MRGLFAATALVAGVAGAGAGTARAEPLPAEPAPARAAVLVSSDDEIAADAIGRALLARRAAAERVAPPPVAEPTPEAEVADVRALYAQMRFPQAILRIAAHTEALIAGQLPDAARLRALAELMRWDGALRLLGGDASAAAERFTLAARLDPATAPDRIFPPEVQQAWRAAQRGSDAPPVAVTTRVAPPDARIWIDGKLAQAPITTTLGLHYVVVERSDRRPVARLLRVTREAPEIAAQLSTPVAADAALRQASARLSAEASGVSFAPVEASGVAAALARPLWIVRGHAGTWRAERYPAPREARAMVTLPPATDAEAIARAMADTEEALRAAPATAKRDRRPLWRRGWFWGVLGASVVVVAGAVTGAAVAATAPRDYVVQVR